MTEHYWQRYKQQTQADAFFSDNNEIWKRTRQDIKRREKPKHHLELYSYCKTENPFIRQIKNSPNITIDTVAELICREKACELQYCMSLQRIAAENRRANINLHGCVEQYQTMTSCLQTEKNRIKQKELELRNLVETGIKLEIKVEEKKKVKEVLPILEKEIYI